MQSTRSSLILVALIAYHFFYNDGGTLFCSSKKVRYNESQACCLLHIVKGFLFNEFKYSVEIYQTENDLVNPDRQPPHEENPRLR